MIIVQEYELGMGPFDFVYQLLKFFLFKLNIFIQILLNIEPYELK